MVAPTERTTPPEPTWPDAGGERVIFLVDASSPDAFFNQVLFHELSHGLGPGRITVDGRETEVRLELKELYSALEEAKADVMGVWNILYLMDRDLFPAEMRESLFATYAAGLFRSTRFGIAEAHGRGTALQFHYLVEKGAIVPDEASGIVRVDMGKMGGVIRDLVHDLCMLQARGDYDGTKAMLERYAVMSPVMERALGKLEGIPVDLRPVYPAAGSATVR